MSRVRTLNLHGVQTIGQENIIAGRLLLAPGSAVAMVLVHAKARNGGADVIVRSAAAELSTAAAALLRTAFE